MKCLSFRNRYHTEAKPCYNIKLTVTALRSRGKLYYLPLQELLVRRLRRYFIALHQLLTEFAFQCLPVKEEIRILLENTFKYRFRYRSPTIQCLVSILCEVMFCSDQWLWFLDELIMVRSCNFYN